MPDQVVVRHQGEGDAFWMLGGLYEVKGASDETGGGMSVMEMTMPAGMGPPPHVHDGAEAVYVLEGHVRYHIGDDVAEGGPGTFFYIPKGTVENFEPTEQTRVLVIYAPGGMDKFFAEAGERAPERKIPSAPEGPPDVDRMAEIGSRHGVGFRAPARTS
jgi:quercetin dioxygenase-like cupin family protein